ncbi:50S ribosomal protein L9 [Clostridia bacterium]|nr:50S ribosomal protein L9 [Clostridia bacterium]
MKVLFLADVAGTAKKDQVLEVSDGYARNYLLPKKLAKPATNEVLNAVKLQRQAESHREQKKKEDALAVAKRLSKGEITVSAKTGGQDRLYGSITAEQVSQALSEQHGITVEKRRITLPESIKTIGEYPISIWLTAGVETDMTLKVVAKA